MVEQMQLDGHIKLTCDAIAQLQKTKIQTFVWEPSRCRFSRRESNWIDTIDAFAHWATEHSGLNHFVYRDQSLFDPGLAAQVAWVDLLFRETHTAASGQRYHFMRAQNETLDQAIANGTRLIYDRLVRWLIRVKGEQNQVQLKKRDYLADLDLAVALHTLQDSFSPSHVKREQSSRGIWEISEIYQYHAQDHSEHRHSDFKAGTSDSRWGRLAAQASAELLQVATQSATQGEVSPASWESFRQKWFRKKAL